jgi:hypothetical protein
MLIYFKISNSAQESGGRATSSFHLENLAPVLLLHGFLCEQSIELAAARQLVADPGGDASARCGQKAGLAGEAHHVGGGVDYADLSALAALTGTNTSAEATPE